MRNFFIAVFVVLIACGATSGAAHGAIGDKVPLQARPFDLKDVRLLDGPARDAMQRTHRYLIELDPERLLHMFRVTAGLPSSAEPLGGWEVPKGELRGHSLGHYLSACALMYASTGDEQLKVKADAIVADLARCQAAMSSRGYHPGYLSAYPEEFFDRVDARKPVWAPYYTLHKIMAGLLDVHQHCGNRQALEVLDGMAAWLSFRVNRLAPEQMQQALNNEHGGMNEVLANLYAVTGKAEHLQLAKAFNHLVIFEPLARGEDRLNGLHANTQIPKIIGAAREYELTGDKTYCDVALFFWQRVAMARSYVIGGHSDREHFYPIEQTSKHLSPETAETCNTYNMLKLTRHLFAWDASAATMDFYERGLWNQILASQDPRQGMVIYFASLKPGHFKAYSTPHDSFWCCHGTGMENHAKYGDTIFFHDDRSLYLNLFLAAELTWKEKQLVVRQETRFPEEDTTRLTFHCPKPVSLSLKVRWPAWADRGLTIAINGKSQQITGKPGSYVSIDRPWQDGDQVVVRFPMRLHIEALPDDPQMVAFLYGPIVLAGELGTQGLDGISPYCHKQLDLVHVPTPEVPVLVGDVKELCGRVVPTVGRPLVFRTRAIGRPTDVTLSPYYRLHYQRYTIYWKVLADEQQWHSYQAQRAEAERHKQEYDTRRVDDVQPGDAASEKTHGLQGARHSSGTHQGRGWRHARDGWFSWNLKVLPDKPVLLACTYWGDDNGSREFDILVDGQKIASQKLARNKPGEFFDVEYPLPPELLRGKTKVTVKFTARPDCIAGGVFGCAIVKLKK